MIHETAIVHPNAKLGKNVKVGPYSVIGDNVEIGDNTEIMSHVVIKGHTIIGQDNKIFQYASVGEDPQDLKYKDGDVVYLKIGDRNIIREFCTLNRGTVQDIGETVIGNDNLLMAYVHIAHDCIVGNNVILSNNASLAGHVKVDDHAILGGLSGTHQFCRIGSYSFAAGGSMISKDVPPYVMVSGYYAKPFGLNTVGLKRKGFSDDAISNIKKAYKTLYRNGHTTKEAIEELKSSFAGVQEIDLFIEVLEGSERGIVR